jgi:hypothetical protein
MKNFTRYGSLLLLMLALNTAYAQTNFRLVIDGIEVFDNGVMYFRCNNNGGGINARYNQNSNTQSATVQSTAITSTPPGWSFYNDPDNYTLRYNKSTPQDGLLVIQIAGPGVSKTMHVFFRISPVVTFSSVPSLGNNQSGTAQVYVDPSYNPYSAYTSVNYTTDHGLRVNGGTSYSNGNTGDYNSASISTTGWGGNLYVTATNACATSPAISTAIGTPYIIQATVNGTPDNGGTNYVSSYANLNLNSNATSYT